MSPACRKVIIERIKFVPRTRKDHLVKVPRHALYLSAHDVYEPVESEREKLELLNEGRAHYSDRFLVASGIVCDVCGDPITTRYVWVLVLCNPWRPWGTLCGNCRERYHKDKPAYIAVHKHVGVL